MKTNFSRRLALHIPAIMQAFVMAFLMCLLVGRTGASEIEHLNIARVLITDQGLQSQRNAGAEAFKQVVTKLSGRVDSVNNEVFKKAAQNFERYLVSSSFVQIDGRLVYQATFNQDKLIDLLKFAEQAVWGSRRPDTILWLATETDGQQKDIVNQVNDHGLASVIKTESFTRGIDINLPLGDLEDKLAVSTYDVWGLFSNSIAVYSDKYGHEYSLVAKIYLGFDEITSKEAYIAEWSAYNTRAIYSVKSSGATREQALISMVNDYSQYLSGLYAIQSNLSNERQSITLQISNVTSLSKYADVLSALSSIAVVDEVALVKQERDLSTFSLNTTSGLDELSSIFQFDKRLRKLDSANQSSSLNYDWIGN